VNPIAEKMLGMAKGMAGQFLSATVWRVAWSLPMTTLLILAAVVFVVLAVI
jgi:hypothetical protein